ncbi:hypothetical protein ACLQ2R_31015 [Streptosporangium sp. DT93]|uniref:hypothetical protein n=1 Tax=Streptosporangium sp. DT93 TaxID=3393428 RepID=UPI003CEBDD94
MQPLILGGCTLSHFEPDTPGRLGVTRSRGAIGTDVDNALAELFNTSLEHKVFQGAYR